MNGVKGQAQLTVAVGDTRGTKKGSASNPYGIGGSGVYVMDPPLGSVDLGSQGSRKSSAGGGAGNAYYEGGSDGDALRRSVPADRNMDRVNVLFVDTHAEGITPDVLDGMEDGQADNRHWNGEGSPSQR